MYRAPSKVNVRNFETFFGLCFQELQLGDFKNLSISRIKNFKLSIQYGTSAGAQLRQFGGVVST